MATRFKEKGEKPVTPLSSQKPKNQNQILPPRSKSKRKHKKKNHENLKTLFVLCNNRRFKCYPIPSMQQQTIQKVGFDSGNWLPSNYEVLLRKVFDDCTKVLLSLSLCVCLFSVWVLRKCVKIKSFEFLDMVFDWLWWGFRLLGFEKMRKENKFQFRNLRFF